MTDQKIENLLNLSIDATEEEREKSLELNVGYEPLENTWELIVRYAGDLANNLQSLSEEIQVVTLLNGYAILEVPESLITRLSQLPEILYIEKPKRLFFAVNMGKSASCFPQIQYPGSLELKGRGTIVAVLDSGVSYQHPDFRNSDGTTRILSIWDQTISGNPPKGYRIGTEYDREQINLALLQSSYQEQLQIVPSVDTSGHGTAVLGIAAGNGRAGNGVYQGAAPESEIIVVKLGVPGKTDFPRTTELMQAVNYVVEKSVEYGRPIAINLSFGNTYGSHDGTSLLETYLDDMSAVGKNSIVVGTGNEGATAGHTTGTINQNEDTLVEIGVASYETGMNLQIWKSYSDEFDIVLQHPNGTTAGPIQQFLGPQRFTIENTELLLYYGEPSPYSMAQEIYIDFIPRQNYIDSGIWIIRLVPKNIVSGNFEMWLPSAVVLNRNTGFLYPVPFSTFTIPSTARKVISVGAYNARISSYADFSGRGFATMDGRTKPNLVAPGVDIRTTAVNGGYETMTGTSFATPFVTGAAALLMEWGIVRENDPYLYGEKVKAYLQKGARQLPGFDEYPNNQVGWGALCVRDSLPV